MNAEDIFKKYVLQETPTEDKFEFRFPDEMNLVGGARGSGRTTRAMGSLTPFSRFVSPTKQMAETHKAHYNYMWGGLDHEIRFISLSEFLNYRTILGTRAVLHAMVGFDHTVYDRINSREVFQKFLEAVHEWSVRDYHVDLNERVMEKLASIFAY